MSRDMTAKLAMVGLVVAYVLYLVYSIWAEKRRHADFMAETRIALARINARKVEGGEQS